MANSENETIESVSDVRLGYIWPFWKANQKWRNNLAKKAAHKSLDIPEDDMQITNTKNGIGTLGALGIAAAAGIPSLLSTALIAYLFLKQSEPPASVPTAPPAAAAPSAPQKEQYDIEFFQKNSDGTFSPIDVERYKPQ